MIIFGTRGVTSTVSEGNFHCPECRARQPYAHRKVRKFFTLYFIPVIPLESLGEYVECRSCNGTYALRVLEYDPEQTSRRAEAEYLRAMRRAMLQMMLADGQISEDEVRVVCSVYERVSGKGLTPAEVRSEASVMAESAIDAAQSLRAFAGRLNDAGKEQVVRALFFVALADGSFGAEEQSFLMKVGRALEMSHYHVQGVVQGVMEKSGSDQSRNAVSARGSASTGH
jgi:uncharacterized tellurite resistance protein B-like protein